MTRTDTGALARTIATTALEKLATDVRLVDLRGVVSYTDYFVICSGSNARQTRAIADHVVEALQEQGRGRPRRRDTDPEGTWLLLDYVDVILHVFTPEAREFYRLETLWGQVPQEQIGDEGGASDAPSSATGDAGTRRAATVE